MVEKSKYSHIGTRNNIIFGGRGGAKYMVFGQKSVPCFSSMVYSTLEQSILWLREFLEQVAVIHSCYMLLAIVEIYIITGSAWL
jgi:hypothetical protein